MIYITWKVQWCITRISRIRVWWPRCTNFYEQFFILMRDTKCMKAGKSGSGCNKTVQSMELDQAPGSLITSWQEVWRGMPPPPENSHPTNNSKCKSASLIGFCYTVPMQILLILICLAVNMWIINKYPKASYYFFLSLFHKHKIEWSLNVKRLICQWQIVTFRESLRDACITFALRIHEKHA